MVHVQRLAGQIGVRLGGTEAEMEAARYAQRYLERVGYDVVVNEVPIPNGRTSHNVIAIKQGSSPLTLVIGAHIDSQTPSPGGNDNASGVAVVLELARDVQGADVVPTVVFVLFGNEEMIDRDRDHHHYGSRSFVASMTEDERANTVGMISVDMVGYGDTLNVRTMGRGPRELRDILETYADKTEVALEYMKDPSPYGYSDHEPFELAGYPAVWLEWREDPLYHTEGDTYEHCQETRVQDVGAFVLAFVTDLGLADLEALKAAKD